MKGKILFLAGVGVGYLLGTRAGRERYEQIKSVASQFWNAPVVQRRVDDVQDFVREKAPEVTEFVADGAKKLVAQVSGRSEAKPAAAKKPAASAAKKAPARKTAASTTRSSAKSSGTAS